MSASATVYDEFMPIGVSIDSTSILTNATYEPFGPPDGWTWGNGATSSRSFDLRGLPTTLSVNGDTQALQFDANGRLTSQSDTTISYSYGYDLLDRVTSYANASGGLPPNSQAMAYDANDNRTNLTEDGTPYSYTNLSGSNRILSAAGPIPKTYTYDASGNVLADGVHTYSYDDRGRLSSVDSGAATYQLNGLGQRVSKNNGATTLFAYGENGNLLGEYDSAGNPILEHVWFAGAPVAVVNGTDSYYVHTDHLGTPRVVSDGNTAIWRWDSDPFGASLANEDPDGDSTTFVYNLRFPGQYYDVETALHYNYFRTYDPSTGRYLESDPIGLGGGLNTYGYVGGNPLTYVDPHGLVEWNGNIYVYGGGFAAGYSRVKFVLTSECVDGERVYAEIAANMTGLDIGAPYGVSAAGVTLNDPFKYPSVTNLSSTPNSTASMTGAGLGAPFGPTVSYYTLGYAHGFNYGLFFGMEGSFYQQTANETEILKDKYLECGCSAE